MDRVDHALLVAPKHNNTILIVLQHVHVHGLTGYPLLPLGDGLPGGPGGPYKDDNIKYTHTHMCPTIFPGSPGSPGGPCSPNLPFKNNK